jgi:hypothetical protein
MERRTDSTMPSWGSFRRREHDAPLAERLRQTGGVRSRADPARSGSLPVLCRGAKVTASKARGLCSTLLREGAEGAVRAASAAGRAWAEAGGDRLFRPD